MSIVTEVPGVYVEEDHGLSLSVRGGATAIPVFVCTSAAYSALFGRQESNGKHHFHLSSYLALKDFAVTTKHDESGEIVSGDKAHACLFNKAESEKKPIPAAIKTSANIWFGLRAYFVNGGGACYVCDAENLSTSLPDMDDATLVVACGVQVNLDKATAEKHKVFILHDATAAEDGLNANGSAEHYSAFYYPPLHADWATVAGATNSLELPTIAFPIPASAAVAGVMATVDRERGVWKAPANVALQGGLTPSIRITDTDQRANSAAGKAVNFIRQFGENAPPLVWGARTLANNSEDARWRYIPVRRLFNAVERDIKAMLNTVVFEPNHAPTWEKVRAAIDAHLHNLWRDGAFQGVTPKEAYLVQTGKEAGMTDQDVTEGRLIVKVGLAAARPAEFVILSFSQDVAAG